MTIDLSGKTALVTGAGSGIGAACAHSLSKAGALVFVNDLNRETAEKVASAVGGHALPGDVAHPEEWVQPVLEHGVLHALIHNAGYDLATRVGETDRSKVERLHQVMLSGPLDMTQRLLDPLKTADGACVLFIASVHARVTEEETSAYAAAKGGQVAMVNSIAQDLGRFRIRSLAVSPGYVDSPLLDLWLQSTEDPIETRKWAEAVHPMGRMGTPEDVAALVTFLVTPYAEFINATNVVIDGGLSTKLH